MFLQTKKNHSIVYTPFIYLIRSSLFSVSIYWNLDEMNRRTSISRLYDVVHAKFCLWQFEMDRNHFHIQLLTNCSIMFQCARSFMWVYVDVFSFVGIFNRFAWYFALKECVICTGNGLAFRNEVSHSECLSFH